MQTKPPFFTNGNVRKTRKIVKDFGVDNTDLNGNFGVFQSDENLNVDKKKEKITPQKQERSPKTKEKNENSVFEIEKSDFEIMNTKKN